MSSMTIDQLKKTLTEQGITLPPSRSKKADYIKLYEQYTLNDTLGDVYSSDDENPPRTGSQNVTSTSSPSKNDNIVKEVEQLSDDELYRKLKEFDVNIGPVLKNTRRVYERMLIKKLTKSKQSNGYESVKGQNDKYISSIDEFSDSDIEISSKSSKKIETKGKRSSALRESPKPSSYEYSEPETEKSYSSKYDLGNKSSTPGYLNSSKPSRYSYIETVPKGSSYSYIEPETEVDYGSSNLRQRFTDQYDADKISTEPFKTDKWGSGKYNTNISSSEGLYKPNIGISDQYKSGLSNSFKGSLDQYKSGLGMSGQYKPGLAVNSHTYTKSGGSFGDHYTGTWEPNINRYLGAGAHKKVIPKEKSFSFSGLAKNFFLALLLLSMLILSIYIYHQWSNSDPYKMIEDDAERKIQELNEGSGSL